MMINPQGISQSSGSGLASGKPASRRMIIGMMLGEMFVQSLLTMDSMFA